MPGVQLDWVCGTIDIDECVNAASSGTEEDKQPEPL